jgi:hypothetical protein
MRLPLTETISPSTPIRAWISSLGLAAIGGMAWLIGGTSLLGPLLSILLPVALALCRSRTQAWITALVYYLSGSVSITGAVAGYYGTGHIIPGWMAWIGASALLALPWTLAQGRWGLAGMLFALIATALPPLGLIGGLSPLNAAGVLFPATGWIGIALLLIVLMELHFTFDLLRFLQSHVIAKAGIWLSLLVIIAIGAFETGITGTGLFPEPQTPAHWTGLQTWIAPARGNPIQSIANNQALIEAARSQGKDADVVVFPEAIVDDWYPGTRQQLMLSAPPGPTWLIGASVRTSRDKPVNAVVAVTQNHADPVPLTTASGLLLGGDWLPWNPDQGFQMGNLQQSFAIADQKVWAALCIEQLQPWTWLLAMSQKTGQRPTVILAMSNQWWATQNSFAPRACDAAGSPPGAASNGLIERKLNHASPDIQ